MKNATLPSICRVLSIKIEWSESNALTDGATFATPLEFERAIQYAGRSAPDDGSYDKTKFVIVARTDDGETRYTGRVDITRDMAAFWSLGEHILEFVEYVLAPEHGNMFASQRQAAEQWRAFAKVLHEAKLDNDAEET